MRTLARVVATAVLAGAPLAAHANDWRVACSTLAMDESAISPAVIYQFTGMSLRYQAGSTSVNPLVGRISPVNTSINPELPDSRNPPVMVDMSCAGCAPAPARSRTCASPP